MRVVPSRALASPKSSINVVDVSLYCSYLIEMSAWIFHDICGDVFAWQHSATGPQYSRGREMLLD